MLNWKEIPFIRIILPFIIGILFAIQLDIALPYSYAFLSFFILLLLFNHQQKSRLRNPWITGTLLFMVFSILGFQRTINQNELKTSNHYRQHLQKENTVIATVSQMPSLKKSVKLELELQSILKENKTCPVEGKLLAYCAVDSLSLSLKYGDQVIIKNIRINPIESVKNPQQFDNQRYLHFQGIHYQTYLGEGSIEKTGQNKGNAIFSIAYNIRKRFIQILGKHLNNDAYAVGTALILGYKNVLNDDLKEAYSKTGAMHVLAVSGLHVGIIAYILNFLVGFFPKRSRGSKMVAFLFQVIGIFSFALLTGASPSVLRAATMFSLVVGGVSFARSTSIYNILAASAFILLLWNPYYIMQVGFQLSYLAVLSIVYFQPKIKQLIFCNFKPLDYLWSLAAVSIAAQIGTLPVSLYYFHQFPVYFIFSGFIVVPAAGFILSGGLMLFFFELIFPPIAIVIGMLLNGLITLVNIAIFGLKDLPYGIIEGIWLSVIGLIVLYVLLLFIATSINTKQMKWLNYGLVSFILFIGIQNYTFYQKEHQTAFIVYDTPRNSLIDLYQSNHLTSLKDDLLEDKKIQYLATNNRTFRGIQSKESKNLNDLSPSNNKVSFADQSLVILQGATDSLPNNTDYLLIQNSPQLNLSLLLADKPPKVVIFDSSNSNWKVKEWIKECEALQIAYHVTHTAGAFVKEL